MNTPGVEAVGVNELPLPTIEPEPLYHVMMGALADTVKVGTGFPKQMEVSLLATGVAGGALIVKVTIVDALLHPVVV